MASMGDFSATGRGGRAVVGRGGGFVFGGGDRRRCARRALYLRRRERTKAVFHDSARRRLRRATFLRIRRGKPAARRRRAAARVFRSAVALAFRRAVARQEKISAGFGENPNRARSRPARDFVARIAPRANAARGDGACRARGRGGGRLAPSRFVRRQNPAARRQHPRDSKRIGAAAVAAFGACKSFPRSIFWAAFARA